MREVVALTKIYKYEELDSDAQETAVTLRQNELEAEGYGWADEAMATLKAFGDLFKEECSISVRADYSFDRETPALSWTNPETEELKGLALREYITQHYMHKQTEGGELIIGGYENYTLTGCHIDTFILEELAAHMDYGRPWGDDVEFCELISRCLRSWAYQCWSDWGGLMDEETTGEMLRDDNAEFFGDGIRYKEPALEASVDAIDLPRKIQA